MNCYDDYLEYLAENLIHDEQPPLVPASPEQIETIKKDLLKELDLKIPAPYAKFLGQVNGYNYNGVFFFTIDYGADLPYLLDENRILRLQHPVLQEYLVMGQSGLWYYTFHLPTSTYRALQVDALEEPYYIFEDFDDCLSSALEETLELLEKSVET